MSEYSVLKWCLLPDPSKTCKPSHVFMNSYLLKCAIQIGRLFTESARTNVN